jgi:hypothetical protein
MAVPALTFALAVSLGGCKGGSGDGHQSALPASAVPSETPGARADSFAAYRQCLSEHGVTMPTERPGQRPTEGPAPRPSRDATQAAAFREARQECASLRPAGGLRAGGIHSGPRGQFRECMRRQGVELPAPSRPGNPAPGDGPSPEPSSGRGGMFAGLDLNDPTVHKALEDCRSILIDNGSTPSPDSPAAS